MTEPNAVEMEPWRRYVELRLHAGATREDIIAELMPRGWTEESARPLIYWAEDCIRAEQGEEARKAQKWAARKHHMLCGSAVFVAGTGLTIWGYLSPDSQGRFYIWHGAIIIGLVQFLFGLFGGTKTR